MSSAHVCVRNPPCVMLGDFLPWQPWETVFLDGKWVFSKAGAVPGYGSCYAAVPSLNLGTLTPLADSHR